jgi:C-terminal processing protease CtpA/Prc
MDISACRARIEGSDPPSFTSSTYAEYAVEPGGPFAYTGKIAVLIDGLDYSAADYFPYAIQQAAPGTLLVGTPTAGAYGGSGPQLTIDGPPLLYGTYDPNHCEDAEGMPLEGRSVQPDLLVEYDPSDLAAGVDTVMEAAVAALLPG